MDNKYLPPESSDYDKTYATLKAVTTAIPVVGGSLTELWTALFAPSIERRRQEWMEKVATATCKLEIDLNKLQNNQSFLTIYLAATIAALKTHQEQKIQYLLNAVLNSIQNIDVKDDFQNIFIRYIDELTPSHIFFLQFLYDHREEVKNIYSYQNLYDYFQKIEPSNLKTFEFKTLCSDLSSRSLVQFCQTINDFPGVYSSSVWVEDDEDDSTNKTMIKTTDLGIDFLIFISLKGKK
jgi:hypothetical protein